MHRFLYTLVLYAALPLVLWHLWWRGREQPAYRQRVRERFGRFSAPTMADGVWIHAVSVGEVNAAAALIRGLRQAHPQLPLVVTTTTPAGSERVAALFGNSVFHVYAPYDLPGAVARFLDRLWPRVAVFMETEIWPNTVFACRRRGVDVLLVNARLSERSARSYRRFARLTRQVFSRLQVLAQSDTDAQRFAALGVPPTQLQVVGNLKFDVEIDAATRDRAARWRSAWSAASPRPVWIAASTHEGEDEQLLALQRALTTERDGPLLILVPRHPQRCRRVAALLADLHLPYHRFSAGDQPPPNTAVLLVDTIGDLLWLYGCAELAFVGGSLVERGGHNSLEAAAWSLPLLSGPHVFNFVDITDALERAGGLIVVTNGEELAGAVTTLLGNGDQARRMGAAARSVVEGHRGALAKTLTRIEEVLARTQSGR